MKKIKNFLPDHVLILLKRLAIPVAMLYITRLIFLAFNSNAFQHLSFIDFFTALWFDMITVGLFFMPYYVLFLLPFRIHHFKLHRIFFKVLFHLTNTLLIALNLLDVEYFKYTSKRSTFDLFTFIGTGNDVSQLLTTFLRDFWYLVLILFALIALSEFLYRKSSRNIKIQTLGKATKLNASILSFILLNPVFFIIGRGGFALIPTGIIQASTYSLPENTAFILSTPFTMIKTIDQKGIELKNFFDTDAECDLLFNPIQTSVPQDILPDGTNVMVIILESFGIEFVGNYQNGNGYTPFLDSLMDQSLSFTYAFANGKKSIEAVPAIVASLPTLMDNPYISSPYGNNKINGLPSILAKHGYESAFYHGATNGSMSFDAFASISGYNHYVGRNEYNNEKHADASWGILDEYFNPWTAKEISKLKEPFFGTLFTLSSHHPFFIPEHMRSKVMTGPQPICASINYGDYALKKFFEEAKKQPWFDNTLFVILADHSPASKTELYNLRTHMYRIPIMFYHPGGQLKAKKSNRIFQQLDILPTILDLLNIETDYYAYGSSYYQKPEGEAITYLEGTYFYFKDNFMTAFSEDQARNLYCFKTQNTTLVDSIYYLEKEVGMNVKKLKAIIQRYNRDLITNQTVVHEKENSLHH